MYNQRPNLASGISLYVSDDRKVAMGVPPIASEFPDQDGAWVKLINRPILKRETRIGYCGENSIRIS